MKLLPKFSLILAGSASLIMLLLISALFRWNQAYTEMFRQLAEERSQQVTRVLDLKHESLLVFSADYARCRGTIDFLDDPDPAWWESEFRPGCDIYGIDVIAIYDETGTLIFFRNLRNELGPEALGLSVDDIRRTVTSPETIRGYVDTPHGLLEAAVGPVRTFEAVDRGEAPVGVIVSGRFYSSLVMRELQDLTSSSIRYVAERDLPSSNHLHPDDEVQTSLMLTGLHGENIGALVFVHDTPLVALIQRHVRSAIFLVVSILVVILAAAGLTLPNFVLSPIARLRIALTEQTDRPLQPLLQRADEFGQLARLVCEFFEQKQTLTREMAARAEAVREAEAAAREAQRLERVKAEFLATMSHEIRTPMNAVVGFAELLREGKLPDEEQEYAKIVVENSYALLQLLDDILDYSKIESSKLELLAEPMDLRGLVEQIISTYQAKARQKNLLLNFSVDDELPGLIEADSARLRQVLNNLVDNGLKFTERGYVRLAIKVEPEPLDDGRLAVSFIVRDSGIGIRDAHLRQIFEPFTQADSSTTRRFGGTGLGLAICSRLVALMGGKLQVQSTFGHGSTFRFTLPLRPVKDDAVVPSDTPTQPIRNRRLADQLPLHILVVEDNPASGQLIHIHLRRLGYEPVIVTDGLQALERVQRERFDLILLDLQMPRMDGWTFVSQLRQIPRCPWIQTVKIIAVSANKLRVETSALVIAGIHGYVSKPYTFAALVAEIRRVASEDGTIVG